MTPNIMNTTTVSMPRKPRGLMNLEGKTILSARRRVRSRRSQIHRRMATMGSTSPFFLLGGAANSYLPLDVCCGYVPRRVDAQLDLGKRKQAEIVSGASDRHAIGQVILTTVAWALEPKLARTWSASESGIY